VRVLVVEDHSKLAITVATGLRHVGMAVDITFDGTEALAQSAVTEYDVIVLDRDIPGVHGDDVCRSLVEGGATSRVLMLTAAGTLSDRVEGLGIGADDYLAKPFDFSELIARVRALGRRPGRSRPPVLRRGDVELDSVRRLASRSGQRLFLSPKEFGVLEVLLAADGAVVSSEELIERVWDEQLNPFSQIVKTTISRLRSKLGEPTVIETVSRSGYRIS
jgi:DNA-binding response OmpR family regulator